MTAASGLSYLRAWHGDHLRRGATVEYHGDKPATVLSAHGPDVAIRIYDTGRRVIVKPFEIGPVR